MDNKVLTLGIMPLRDDQVRVCTRVGVYFSVSDAISCAPETFRHSDPAWKRIDSDNDLSNTNELLNELAKVKVGSRDLLEFVSYEGICYWQFLPSFLWPSFFLCVELIRTIVPLVKEVAPQTIRIFPAEGPEGHIWSGVISAIGEAYAIPVKVLPEKRSFRSMIRDYLRNSGLTLFAYRMLNSFFYRSLLIFSLKTKKTVSSRKILLASFERHWVDDPGKEGEKYDEQFSPLLPALRSGGWTDFTAIDCPYETPGLVLKKFMERINQSGREVSWKGFYAYGNIIELERKSLRAKRFFEERYRILKGSQTFLKGFVYNGISLMAALEPQLRRAFSVIIPECVYIAQTAGVILKQESPQAVAVTYETGPFQRALVIQAGRMNIPTVGLQHGTIFNSHYDYMHDPVTNDPVKQPFGFTVPTKTCVWGEAWKRNLTQSGHYHPGFVEVTGNCRFDRFKAMQRDISSDRLKDSLGISRSKKVVLVLTSGQRVSEFLETCLEATEGHFRIIKLHPADNPGPVRSLLEKKKRNDVLLIFGNLYQFLSVADAVISQPSTVIAEAILFDKPVIFANFEGQKGYEKYVESCACLYVAQASGLKNALDLAINDQATQARLRQMRERFVEDYFFRIDGCSGLRITEVINRCV